LSLVIFLDGVFSSKTSVKVLPWQTVRKMIFDIYEWRNHATELEASVGGTYPTMDEILCIYFLEVEIYYRRQTR